MRARLVLAAAALLPSLALAAPVGEMSVAEFLPKAENLKAKGMAAMFSSDLKPVVAEMKAIGTGFRADLDRARAGGRTDMGCPPPKGQGKGKGVGIKADEIFAVLRAVPPAQRATTTVKSVFYAMMARRFPC